MKLGLLSSYWVYCMTSCTLKIIDARWSTFIYSVMDEPLEIETSLEVWVGRAIPLSLKLRSSSVFAMSNSARFARASNRSDILH